jgi:hypothetical protein
MKNYLAIPLATVFGLISTGVSAQVNTNSAAYQSGQMVGRVLGFIILAVIVYKVVQWARRK